MSASRLNRLFWWRDAGEISSERCAARVMVMGGWGDVMEARRRFGEEIFAKVLRNPPRGLFDVRSWTFWHKKTGMVPVPPLPKQPAVLAPALNWHWEILPASQRLVLSEAKIPLNKLGLTLDNLQNVQ